MQTQIDSRVPMLLKMYIYRGDASTERTNSPDTETNTLVNISQCRTFPQSCCWRQVIWDRFYPSKSRANLEAGLFSGLVKSQNSSLGQGLSTSYAPITVKCPIDIQWVRRAKGLGNAETEWVSKRKIVVLDALEGYLDRLCLEDFNVHEFAHRMKESNYEHVPTLAMAISGGGYRSGYTGTGIMRAIDSRLPAANQEKTGGLLQSLTYLAGVCAAT